MAICTAAEGRETLPACSGSLPASSFPHLPEDDPERAEVGEAVVGRRDAEKTANQLRGPQQGRGLPLPARLIELGAGGPRGARDLLRQQQGQQQG